MLVVGDCLRANALVDRAARRLSVDFGRLELFVMRFLRSSIDLELDDPFLADKDVKAKPCRSGTLDQRFTALTLGLSSFIVMDASSASGRALSEQMEMVTLVRGSLTAAAAASPSAESPTDSAAALTISGNSVWM